MQEREVTVGQDTMHLPDPFFVIATQNPIEQEGTYPLPEAQLDRFMFDIRVGYPSLEEEKKILLSTTKGEAPDLKKVLSGKAIVNLQKLVTSVPVSDYTVDYVARLVRATRPNDERAPQFIKDLVDYGAGPRAGQNLILAGKAMAAMDGRFSVSLDDVRRWPPRSSGTASAPTSRPRPKGRRPIAWSSGCWPRSRSRRRRSTRRNRPERTMP